MNGPIFKMHCSIMKRNSWIILFGLVLAVHLLALQVGWVIPEIVTKPLIVLIAAAYFFSATKNSSSVLKMWIGLALLFSLGGDILLMLQQTDSLFFLFGLSSFLLAHIFYIIFFHRVRLIDDIKSRLWTLVVVAVYYTLLISFLNPWLGDMRLPVRVYGVVISFMMMLALHMLFLRNRTSGRFMSGGALLFVISDSILAINKFYQPFEGAGLIIMLTYGLAQLFLVIGAAGYINGISSERKS
ncbi:MAG: lysoplasmalogenase [Chitinophagaceae bacterium]|nr:MAG: lysoplasmalogenase [Chitinophagaceae bacterium]